MNMPERWHKLRLICICCKQNVIIYSYSTNAMKNNFQQNYELSQHSTTTTVV